MLCFICVALLIIRLSLSHLIKKSNIIIADLPLAERHLDEHRLETKNYPSPHSQLKLFAFDPNTVTSKQLLQLGLKEKTVTVFLKFRAKGFVFKHKEDVKKVYGISDDVYKKMEPYILIENKEKPPVTYKETRKTVKKIIELNGADSLTLLEITGVGPSFAKRILKYRSLLGGFENINQLLEVYGLTEEIFQTIKPQISLDASFIKKLNLNKDDFKTVNKHPYLSYEITKQIFDKRRKEVITPQNLEALINNEAQYHKLLPYVTF